MKQTTLSNDPDARSPAGAYIRFIMDGPTGNMIHSTVPPGQINRATIHATVSEFWHVLSGKGEIWRRQAGEDRVTALLPGTSIDIPVGTAFQYRNTGSEQLTFICISMPPWPGDHEATHLEGPWKPTI
jgi:mannose-6-phosphate isomerase-like protein (cupin superfamily)